MNLLDRLLTHAGTAHVNESEAAAEIERLESDSTYVRDRLVSRDDPDRDTITIRDLIDEATNSGDFFPAYELRRQREARKQHSQTVANIQEVVDIQKAEIKRLTRELADAHTKIQHMVVTRQRVDANVMGILQIKPSATATEPVHVPPTALAHRLVAAESDLAKVRADYQTYVDGNDHAMDGEVKRLQEKRDKYRDACQFAIEKCVSRTAGNSNDPFAWLPQRDWDAFVVMAREAAKGTQ